MRSLVFIFCICTTTLFAQDNPVLDVLAKVQSAFIGKTIWANVDIAGYKKAKDSKSFHIGTGEFRIIPEKGYYSSFDGEVYISDKNRTLMIDEEGKAIGVVEQGMKDVPKNPLSNADVLKKSVNMADSIRLEKPDKKGTGKIIIYIKNSLTPVTEIWYNAGDFMMTKIVYHYNNTSEGNFGAEKMVVSYTYNDTKSLKEDFFSTSKIVQKKVSGKYETEGPYKSFKVYKM